MAEQADASPTTLNDLPESLLIHILTLLPILSAIETSFISRQWRNLWLVMPSLQFTMGDQAIFTKCDAHTADTITQVLFHRPRSNPLCEFRLKFLGSSHSRHHSLVTAWIRYALDCKVEDMSLSLQDYQDMYRFHFFDISSRHVRCLRLCFCEIVMPRVGSIQFDSLRELYLDNVFLDDDSITDLISRCRNLEMLDFSGFDGSRYFKICSTSLKALKMSYLWDISSSIEIHAPNLSSVSVTDSYAAIYARDLSSVKQVELSIWDAHVHFQRCWGNALSLFCNVESLKIKYILPRYVLSDRCIQLERLKHLEVWAGYTFNDRLGVLLLLERAPALQTFVFSDAPFPEGFSDDVDEEGFSDDVDEEGFSDDVDEDGFSDDVDEEGFSDDVKGDGEEDDEDIFSDEFNNLSIKLHFPSLLEVKIIGFRNTRIERWILLLFRKHMSVLNKVVLVPAIRGEPTVVLDPTSDAFFKFCGGKEEEEKED